MLNGNALADAIRSAMGFPTPLSTQLIGWGTAVVEHIQTAALVDHPVGTVTGTVPGGGGALIDGAADFGEIYNLNASTLATLIANYAGYGYVSGQLLIFCQEIKNHIETYGVVEFATGNIVGNCTNTGLSSGTFTGTGHDGFIKSLNGPILANAIHVAVGYPGSTSTKLTQFCTALVTYIMANAVVTHTNVTGTCPAGGGALIDGAANNGTIA